MIWGSHISPELKDHFLFFLMKSENFKNSINSHLFFWLKFKKFDSSAHIPYSPKEPAVHVDTARRKFFSPGEAFFCHPQPNWLLKYFFCYFFPLGGDHSAKVYDDWVDANYSSPTIRRLTTSENNWSICWIAWKLKWSLTKMTKVVLFDIRNAKHDPPNSSDRPQMSSWSVRKTKMSPFSSVSWICKWTRIDDGSNFYIKACF